MEEQKATPTEPISMEHWEDELEETLTGTELRRGELREGTILDMKADGFVVDIGAKRDGFVPTEDLEDLEDQAFESGQPVSVVVTKFRDSDGNVELSISQALLREDWIKAEQLKEEEAVHKTTVTGSNRGGLTIDFGHLRGFVPMSQLIGFSRIRQPSERQRRLKSMVGKPIMLKVIEVNRRRRRLILSQKAAAREWRAERRRKLLEDLEPDQVRRGRISQITDFGLFVNLGGLDGLVHISELSWGRVEDPNEFYRRGQRIKVKVLNVDRDRQRIGLSIKALTPDPWETATERYNEGQLVEGTISQVVDFGIFVELEPGIEGLLHNTELRDFEQREELEAKQKLLVKIIRVEPDRRRIGLSVRQVQRHEWEEWVVAQTMPPLEEEQVEEEEKEASEAAEANAAAEQQPEKAASEAEEAKAEVAKEAAEDSAVEEATQEAAEDVAEAAPEATEEAKAEVAKAAVEDTVVEEAAQEATEDVVEATPEATEETKAEVTKEVAEDTAVEQTDEEAASEMPKGDSAPDATTDEEPADSEETMDAPVETAAVEATAETVESAEEEAAAAEPEEVEGKAEAES